ncbi:hypothetical protein E8D34_00725 [Nocardioides sp. GY 10113]|uniref:hypothetical protein n=1 Tax=Nocardioides sp. GY 10113 TaxID=2569761 RepID=UPI0010A8EFCB|nr:hypothetical protein [Nocardioides sp. GY 10113]TIC89071.1 hypothetical protein E8D34_00725 [Nocardioides sp. GY 10113]
MPPLPRSPRTDRPRLRTAAALAALPVLTLGLAACSDDEAAPRPDLPTETPALWNPCDAITEAFVKKHLGAETTKNDGTPTQPDCRFAPEADSGDPVLTANYQLFDGTLDELWSAMGQESTADVRDVDVPGADGARLVVDARNQQLYVTGFVENGTLFQVVNVADPKPYDEEMVVAGVEETLRVLSRHAVDSGAGKPAPASESPAESASESPAE